MLNHLLIQLSVAHFLYLLSVLQLIAYIKIVYTFRNDINTTMLIKFQQFINGNIDISNFQIIIKHEILYNIVTLLILFNKLYMNLAVLCSRISIVSLIPLIMNTIRKFN